MKGYYKNEAATNEAIDKDGFLHSGDLGVKDENGNYGSPAVQDRLSAGARISIPVSWRSSSIISPA